MMNDITFVPIESISSLFLSHRRYYDETHIRSLQDLLEADESFHLDPVVLLPREGGQYAIVSGYHRVEAYRRAGRLDVPAVIVEDEQEAAVIASRENARGVSPLSVHERRAVAAELLKRGFSEDEISQYLHVSPRWVWRVKTELEEKARHADAESAVFRLEEPERKPRPKRPKSTSREKPIRAADGFVSKEEEEEDMFAPLIDWEVVFERLSHRSVFLIRQLEDYSKALSEVLSALERERSIDAAVGRYKYLKPVLQVIVERFRDVYKLLQSLHQRLDRSEE